MFNWICKKLEKAGSFSRKSKKDEGWSFIETIIVIGIGLILTGAIGFTAFQWLDTASSVTAKNDIKTLSMALSGYRLDCGNFPSEEQGLGSLYTKPSIAPVPEKWNGPYIDTALTSDPWGNDYVYQVPGPDGLPFLIKSLGKDGQEGGEGENADILSTDR